MKTPFGLNKFKYSFGQKHGINLFRIVPAPNKSDSAEAAEVMVTSLVPLWHKSGTAVRCLLPLPWLSLCPMPWLSVTGGTRLQSEQDEKEHRKRKIFFS